jgi:uncharacterized protein (DUF983 family)
MNEDQAHYPPIEPVSAGLRGCCPRCGQGKLFSGFLSVAPRCMNCGLDNAFADSGDGPVVFVILIVGFLVVGTALWMQVALEAPVWLVLLLTVPVAIGLSLWLMRALKGVLIALQYAHKARPGEIDRG